MDKVIQKSRPECWSPMLSRTVEYALRVIVYLASRNGEPAVTRDIAVATRVPEGYLSKVLQGLSKAGLVRSQRGLHGGSILGRPQTEMSVYDVIQSVDPIVRISTCPLGLTTHGVNLCPLHRKLDNAMALMEKAFRSTRIVDLQATDGSVTPLCETSDAEKPNNPFVRLRITASTTGAAENPPPKSKRGKKAKS